MKLGIGWNLFYNATGAFVFKFLDYEFLCGHKFFFGSTGTPILDWWHIPWVHIHNASPHFPVLLPACNGIDSSDLPLM